MTADDLFADLDFNSDLSLELLELNRGEQLARDSVRLLSKVCRLQDLITFYDTNQDALLSLTEFYSSLGKSNGYLTGSLTHRPIKLNVN